MKIVHSTSQLITTISTSIRARLKKLVVFVKQKFNFSKYTDWAKT